MAKPELDTHELDFLLEDRKEFRRSESVFQYPFVKLVLFLILGLLAGYYFHLEVKRELLLGVFVVFLLLSVFSSDLLFVKNFLIFTFVFLLGAWVIGKETPLKPTLERTKGVFLAIALDEPKVSAKTKYLPVEVLAVNDSGKWQKCTSFKALLYIKKSFTSDILYGDTLLFYTQFTEVKNLGNPFEFDYQGYLARKGIFYSGFVDSSRIKLLGHGGGKRVIYLAHKLRRYLLDVYKRYGLPKDLYSLAGALTLGYRQELAPQLRESFAHTGAMHVLAVSGLHVGVLFAVLFFGLRRFFTTKLKWLIFIIIVTVLWGFAFLTGLSPSVRRSAFMFSLITLGKATKRQPNIFNTLAASAFFMLLLFPFDLFEAGFWLSYSAVVSIVVFQPMFYRWFYFRNKILDKIWALMSVSLAAQLGTMPIGLYLFHQFPNYFLLTNLLAVPLASVILYSALLLFLFSFVPFLAKAIMFVLKIALLILLKGVQFIESLPGAYSSDLYITFFQMLLLYAMIWAVVNFFVKRKKVMVKWLLVFILLFVLNSKLLSYVYSLPGRVIFYNIPKHNSALVVNAQKGYLIADTSLIKDSAKIRRYFTPYLKIAKVKELKVLPIGEIAEYRSEVVRVKRNFWQIFDHSFYFACSSKIFDSIAPEPLKIQYVIVANNVYLAIRDLKQLFDFEYVLFAPSNKGFKIEHWIKQARSERVKFVDLTQGAAVIYQNDSRVRYWKDLPYWRLFMLK